MQQSRDVCPHPRTGGALQPQEHTEDTTCHCNTLPHAPLLAMCMRCCSHRPLPCGTTPCAPCARQLLRQAWSGAGAACAPGRLEHRAGTVPLRPGPQARAGRHARQRARHQVRRPRECRPGERAPADLRAPSMRRSLLVTDDCRWRCALLPADALARPPLAARCRPPAHSQQTSYKTSRKRHARTAHPHASSLAPPLQGPCWAHGITATALPACSSAWARRGAPAQTAMHAPTGCTASSPQATRDRCTHGTQSPPLHSARPARQGAPWRSTRSRPVGAGRPERPSPSGASRITGRANQFQVVLAMCMCMHMQCSHGPRHAGLRSELRPVGAEAARVAGCRLQAEQDRHGAAGPDATAPMPPQRGPSARPRPRRRTGYGARSAAPATSAATGRHWPG